MNVADREELLAPFAPLERVRPRRLDDSELLAFAGVSRHALYRLIEAGELVPERSPKRGSHCYVTLAQIARWRASRFTPTNEKAAVLPAAAIRSEKNARPERTPATFVSQAR